ncbi:MAG: hypothetical protein ACYTDY_19955 [Planctomycetota bacterium]|jgi:hypothetical protein
MLKNTLYVGLLCALVGGLGLWALREQAHIGPVVLALGALPLVGLVAARRPLKRAIPDFTFGAIDTGLLTIPCLAGGLVYGVPGAIAGGVVGDAITDSIAGFFEGSVAKWLRSKGVEESREPVTTSLGKMAGCLIGAGFVLSAAWLAGVQPRFE